MGAPTHEHTCDYIIYFRQQNSHRHLLDSNALVYAGIFDDELMKTHKYHDCQGLQNMKQLFRDKLCIFTWSLWPQVLL